MEAGTDRRTRVGTTVAAAAAGETGSLHLEPEPGAGKAAEGEEAVASGWTGALCSF